MRWRAGKRGSPRDTSISYPHPRVGGIQDMIISIQRQGSGSGQGARAPRVLALPGTKSRSRQR